MATVAQLNVAIGTRLDGLRSGLKQAERELRISGQRLSNLGNDLSIAISAPLAAFGASAVKAAGDMQALQLALETTMVNGGRTIAEARMEMEALRQAALAPGLDFEQAVRGSVRLQNVGFQAEEARAILVELANAVAMTGGSAQELDGVTRQFGQMIAKGRVMQEDLTIIQENMPAISAAMEKAFGTKSAEQLREMGVSAEDFIKGVTKQLAELPRVEGGIKNAITNAGSAIQQFLASVGKEIDKAFNLGKVADDFAKFLADAAKWFSQLDDSTKKAVVQVGLFVVALGPAVKLLGVLRGAGSQFVGVLADLTSMTKTASGAVLRLAQYLGNVRGALLVLGGGVALAAISAVAGAVFLLANNTSAAEVAAKEFGKAQKAINEELAMQTAGLNKNIEVLKNANSTTEQRKVAINELKAAYPDYLRNINLETASSAQLTKIHRDLNDEIMRGVVERQRATAINAIYEERGRILLRINALRKGDKATAGEATLIDTGDMIRAGGITEAVILKLEQKAADLRLEAEKVGKQFDETFGTESAPRRFTPLKDLATAASDLTAIIGGDGGGRGGGGGKTLNSALSETKKKTDEATQGMTDLQVSMKDAYRRALQFSKAFSASQPGESNAGLPTVDDGLGSALDLGKSLTPSITGVNLALSETIALTDAVSKKWTALADQVEAMGGGPFVQMQALLTGIGEALGPIGELAISAFSGMAVAAMEGAASMAELGKAAVGAFAKIAKMLIMEIALRAALKAVEKGSIFGALAAVGIAAALIGGLTALTKAIKVPAYAEGTNYAKGGLSLVGERGPELVNLPRGSQVIPNHVMRGMGGSSQLQGQFVLSRGDLILAVRSAAAQYFRETGKNPFDVR